MRWRVFTLDIFLRASASTGRTLALVAVEGAFIIIGALIIAFIFPRLDGMLDDSQLKQMPFVVLARQSYWFVIAALLAHALLTSVILPRLRAPWLGVWLGLGMFLPVLVVIVPLVVVGGIYSAILSDLTQ